MLPSFLHSLRLHMILAAGGGAVVALHAFVAAGADKRFSALAQELLEVNRARAELLFFGEWDILCDGDHLLLLLSAKKPVRSIPCPG